MPLSAFDLYSVGIGPSSSHTVGPMRAGARFVAEVTSAGLLDGVGRVKVELFGSLAATGVGHCTPRAVLLGLMGEEPATVDVDGADLEVARVHEEGRLRLAGGRVIGFDAATDLLHHRRRLPAHPNGMTFTALGADGGVLLQRSCSSIGGGVRRRLRGRGR